MDGPFVELRRATNQLQGSNLPSSKALGFLSDYLPTSYTWSELSEHLARPEDEDKPQYVLALIACVRAQPSRLRKGDEDGAESKDNEARRNIRRFVMRVLSPIDTVAELKAKAGEVVHTDDPETVARRDKIALRCRSVAEEALTFLEEIGLSSGKEAGGDDDDTAQDDAQLLYTITALADKGQPWTTDAAAAKAADILEKHLNNPTKADFIVDGILKQYLRPLFARSRPATVTESGRKAAFVGSNISGRDKDGATVSKGDTTADSPLTKPWKYVDLRAISVFAWAVHEAQKDGSLVRTNWPLFIPVLLALVEEPETPIRARGLGLLNDFIAAVPDNGALLHTTGLVSVLADAVFPTLLFLPRLTPEEESLQLLGPAYTALLSLSKSAGAGDNTSSTGTAKGLPSKAEAALLDRILREGIYTGYFHASEHIHIVEELVHQAGRIVEAMGVYAVKHLKDLMPMYATILTDPFAMRYKPAVAAGLDALQTTLSSCWPRLAKTPWQEETLKMLMLCWLLVEEQEDVSKKDKKDKKDQKETASLKAQLAKAADTLLAIMRVAGVDIQAAVGPLVASEKRLGPLFRLDESS